MYEQFQFVVYVNWYLGTFAKQTAQRMYGFCKTDCLSLELCCSLMYNFIFFVYEAEIRYGVVYFIQYLSKIIFEFEIDLEISICFGRFFS